MCVSVCVCVRERESLENGRKGKFFKLNGPVKQAAHLLISLSLLHTLSVFLTLSLSHSFRSVVDGWCLKQFRRSMGRTSFLLKLLELQSLELTIQLSLFKLFLFLGKTKN